MTFIGWMYVVDFGIGVLTAQLHLVHDAPAGEQEAAFKSTCELLSEPRLLLTATGLRGLLADVVGLLMVLYLAMPDEWLLSTARLLHLPLWNNSLRWCPYFTLPHVIFLYGSSAGGSAGFTAACLRHPTFADLGKYALGMYLLAYPILNLLGLRYAGMSASVSNPDLGTAAYVIVVLIVSIVYTDLIEGPVVRFVRTRLEVCGAACARVRQGAGDRSGEGRPAKDA